MILAVGLSTSLLVVKGNQDTRNRAAGFDYAISGGGSIDSSIDSSVVTGGVVNVARGGVGHLIHFIDDIIKKKTVVCDMSGSGCRSAGTNEKGMFENYIECEKFCSNPRFSCSDTGCIMDQNGSYKSFDECWSNCSYTPTRTYKQEPGVQY